MGKILKSDILLPFDCFVPSYKVLVFVGFYKMLRKPVKKCQWLWHQIFRVFSFFMVVLFSVQHFAYIVQIKTKDELLEGSIIAIPSLNVISKFLALNLNSYRVDKINAMLAGPTLAPRGKKDKEVLLKNKHDMHLIFKLVMVGTTLGAIVWPVSLVFKRMQDNSYVVQSHYPLNAETWPKFTLTVILETIPLFWVGYGHLTLDCLIATYLAQTIAQLKIIKCSLERIFDENDEIAPGYHSGSGSRYRNDVDANMDKKLRYYVARYETVLWFIREVNDIFDGAVSFQFVTSSIIICLVVYQMSMTPLSVSVLFLLILLVVFLSQIAIYCFYGELIQFESKSVVDSAYLSDWLSLSPKFRRLLLIAMLRWSRPTKPTVSAVVPLSLNTFISIVKFAYSLYTILRSTKHS